MDLADYLHALTEQGFSYKALWSAKETGQAGESVWSFAIYAPDRHLLTSIVVRGYTMGREGATPGLAIYFCAEDDDVKSDIDMLRGIWARQLATQRRRMKTRELREKQEIEND